MDPKMQIVVLPRSWVVVGEVTEVGDNIVVSKASVVRRWGTTKGLGEIAAGGPTSNTVLDACPDLTVNTLTVILRMDCVADKWPTNG